MIAVSIDVSKIPKGSTKPGKTRQDGTAGRYLDLCLFDNKDGVDKYGNAGFVALSVTKEEREAGTRGLIIGNFRIFGGNKPAPQQRQPAKPQPRPVDPDLDAPEDDIPF